MKTKLSIFIFIVSFCSISSLGQEAKLHDEFSTSICGDMKARLDSFATELQNNPSFNARVILYEGNFGYEPGKNRYGTISPVFGQVTNLTYWMMVYTIEIRGIEPKRMMFVDGGIQENFKVQLWIMPKGAAPPRPEQTLEKIKYRRGSIPRVC